MSRANKSVLAAADLLAAASEVALMLIQHSSYSGSEEKAMKALKKRRPGHDADQYTEALRRGMDLYNAAVALVHKRHAEMKAAGDYYLFADELESRVPGFQRDRYRDLLRHVYGCTFQR